VPGWVRPPLSAVARVEDFALRLYGRTRSPEVLGSWEALAWMGTTDPGVEGQMPGPYGRGLPTHVAAFQALRIADTIAEGYRWPPESWWAARGFEPADRMSVELWDQLVHNLYDRAHSTGCGSRWAGCLVSFRTRRSGRWHRSTTKTARRSTPTTGSCTRSGSASW
jgi:hypothetical protein